MLISRLGYITCWVTCYWLGRSCKTFLKKLTFEVARLSKLRKLTKIAIMLGTMLGNMLVNMLSSILAG